MKKLIIVIFSIILIMTSSSGTQASFTPVFSELNDIDMHWAEDAVQTLKDIGIMNGYNGYIYPDNIITRGEFTALITRAFGLKPSENSHRFNDIEKNHIFYENICAASDAGIIDGFDDNTFRPDNMITREEIMLIISRIRPDNSYETVYFTDISSDYRYLKQLSSISSDGIINGYPDGSFGPYLRTTRAEAATMVLSAMKKYLPSADYNTVTKLCSNYLPFHFSDNDTADYILTGSAKIDRAYIRYAYQFSAQLGYNIENIPDGMYISSVETSGPFYVLTFEYYISNIVNNAANRYYKGESKISTITVNNETRIYRHNTHIKSEKPINLTWEVFSNPPDATFNGVNVVSPTAFTISSSAGSRFSMLGSDSYGDIYFNSTLTDNYINWAKKNDFDIWAMYKTDFSTLTADRFLNNVQMRIKSADILIKNILYHSLDGINFDFENMFPENHSAYTNHVREISNICHALGVTVSVDVTVFMPSSLTWSMCFNRNSLAKYSDYIILMAYDQYYEGSPVPGPVSGIKWTEEIIHTTLREVEADRLVLGIPFYIRCWETQNGKVISSKAISMSQAKNLISSNNAELIYDINHRLNKYTWKNGKNDYILWLEDSESIRKRVNLVSAYNLAGIASWRRGFETPDIWDTIYNELF